jgi:hypothetical protein
VGQVIQSRGLALAPLPFNYGFHGPGTNVLFSFLHRCSLGPSNHQIIKFPMPGVTDFRARLEHQHKRRSRVRRFIRIGKSRLVTSFFGQPRNSFSFSCVTWSSHCLQRGATSVALDTHTIHSLMRLGPIYNLGGGEGTCLPEI